MGIKIFKSFILRRKKPISRIHTQLTKKAKERIASITNFVDKPIMINSLKSLQDDVGISEISRYIVGERYRIDLQETHNKLIQDADQGLVFSYLEYLLRYIFNRKKEHYQQYYSNEFLVEIYKKINNIFVEEGILWELKIKEDRLGTYLLEFKELSSIIQKESDEELQSLYLGTEWEKSLKPYNEAYGIFFSGRHTTEIAEKLYSAFENIIKKICLDNSWETNNSLNAVNYLNRIKDKMIFNQERGIMFAEIQDLLSLMKKTFAKIGGNRKRHIFIDKYLCNLLLHQSSSWFVYIIKKYEEFKKNKN